jgi:hypothetical protein
MESGFLINIEIQNALLKEMEKLPASKQRRVLDFARSLAEELPEGTPGSDLLEFAGILTPEEAREMMQAIEEGCERIDPNG